MNLAFHEHVGCFNSKIQIYTMLCGNWSLKAIQSQKQSRLQNASRRLSGKVGQQRSWLSIYELSDVQFNSSKAESTTTTQRSLAVTWTYQSVGVWRYVTTVARKDEHVLNTVWWRGSGRVRASCVAELRRLTAMNCDVTNTNKPWTITLHCYIQSKHTAYCKQWINEDFLRHSQVFSTIYWEV